jgi:Flp pilus assembly protein TadG
MAMWKTRDRSPSDTGADAARGAAAECTDATARLLRANHGTGLVEFALVLPILLALMFGIFEFGRIGMAQLTARHAVAEATRYAVTGRQRADPETGELIPRSESIRQVLRENVGGLALTDSIVIVPEDGGGPEDLVTVSVSFSYEYFLPGLAEWLPPVDFTVRTSMKNEPFNR